MTNKTASLEIYLAFVLGGYEWAVILTVLRASATPGGGLVWGDRCSSRS